MGDSFVTNDVGDDGKTSRSFQGFILFNGTSFQVLIMMECELSFERRKNKTDPPSSGSFDNETRILRHYCPLDIVCGKPILNYNF